MSSADYFQNKLFFFKKFFQEHYKRLSVKLFGSRLAAVGPDLGPNCLQRLSADDRCRR